MKVPALPSPELLLLVTHKVQILRIPWCIMVQVGNEALGRDQEGLCLHGVPSQ